MDRLANALLTVGIGIIVTLITTIILCITVVPDKKRDSLKGFGRFLNDIFNFRSLLIEAIIKFFYVLLTTACIVMGVFMLFLVTEGYNPITGDSGTIWYGWIGVILMIVGPIIVRLLFEGFMLFILLVKNTIQINNKLKNQYAVEKQPKVKAAPVQQNYGYQQQTYQNNYQKPQQTYQPVQQQTPAAEQPSAPATEVLNNTQQQ